jgi:hypothetical protein
MLVFAENRRHDRTRADKRPARHDPKHESRNTSKGKGHKGSKGKGFAGRSSMPSQQGKGIGKSKGNSKGNSKGKDHGAEKNSIDLSSKPGHVGLGGRFFDIEKCVDNLVNMHKFDRQKASRMCFPVGLTLFQGTRALRCCGLEKTPGYEGLHSKYHSFPDGWANEMRSSLSNNQGNFRQPALS